jgi:hypothetical protein
MAHSNMCHISFTYAPMASMWVIALHSLFLYLDLHLPCHPPSYWLRPFLSQTFSHINTPTYSTPVILHTDPPMKVEQSVPKRWHAEFRCQGIAQKKTYIKFLIIYALNFKYPPQSENMFLYVFFFNMKLGYTDTTVQWFLKFCV